LRASVASPTRHDYARVVAQPLIMTPDRRLRVFISSTLRELAVERAAARDAISSLRLAPIFFEQGARPHAPRDLYSAYLDQCDVFVGIYWQSYGWVAPGAAVSGIEDEFELARGKPMLLYIKEPASEREESLNALLRRVEREASYRAFGTDDELRTLVTDDLALLLTERFHSGEPEPEPEPEARSGLPARTTSFVGRDRELGELVHIVERDDVRLVTLTGPGGIGKTRLAVEAARRLAPRFRDGVTYVALEHLVDPDLVPTAIADAIGLASLGPDPAADLARRLRALQVLLVLDNFEHLLAAAPLVTLLLEAAHELEVLATSREPLRLQGEREYGVPPLEDAATLFIERVGAVRPDVAWDAANMSAAGEICDRVDGLPLAVELVAAGARMLPPHLLIEQLGSWLDAPSAGRRDAPARHQTVRATIDWSYGLLTEPERDLFERLGAFAGSFTIEAVRSVAAQAGVGMLPTLSALVEKSLLHHAASESGTRFRMLHVVGEYAGERLDVRPDADDVRAAHAAYYVTLGQAAHAGLRGSQQRSWKEVLGLESENIRRALAYLMRSDRVDDAAELVWSVWIHWLTGHMLEGRKTVAELLGSAKLVDGSRARLLTVDGVLAAPLGDLAATRDELGEALEYLQAHEHIEARAAALTGIGLATAPSDPDRARALLVESADLFAATEDAWFEAMVLGALGWLDAGRGDFAHEDVFERAYALASRVDDSVTAAHAAGNLAELRLAQGRLDEARHLLGTALTAYGAIRLHDGLSYGLEAAARLAWSESHPGEAARLLGAADGVRDEAGLPIWGARLMRFETFAESVRDALSGEAFATSWAEGRALGFDAALEAALRVVRRAANAAEQAN
jgi:predicted ATPase